MKQLAFGGGWGYILFLHKISERMQKHPLFFVEADVRNYSAAGQRKSEDGECPLYWSYVEKATEN